MNKFIAGTQQGIFTTAVKASDLVAKPTLGAELVQEAMTMGKAYSITSNDKSLKESLAKDLQAQFISRVNTLIEACLEMDSMDTLNDMKENGKVAREVYEFIEDSIAARKAASVKTVNLSPVEPVSIAKGINMSHEVVLAGMAKRGLVIGGTCQSSVGQGTVLGFEVDKIGTMVVIAVGNERFKFMANAVQTKNLEESVTVNQTIQNANASASQSDKDIVAAAINGETPMYELSAEQRAQVAEIKLQMDLQEAQEKALFTQAKVAEVAGSSEAQNALRAIQQMGGITPAAPKEVVSAGAPVVAPYVKPAAQASAPATKAAVQPQNKTNGGNVQMTNQPVVNNRNAAGAFGGQTVNGNRPGNTLELNGSFVNQSPALQGWAGITSPVETETDEYTRGANGQQDFVWYLAQVEKYPELLSGKEFYATRANAAIGITGASIYKPEDVVGVWGRTPQDNDYRYVELFMGALSLEFRIKKQTTKDGVPYVFSTNMGRNKSANGTYYIEYVSSRRTDTMLVTRQADGKLREARTIYDATAKTRVVHPEDAPFTQEVKGDSWVNDQKLFGLRIGQQVFIQVMLLMDFYSGLEAAREAKKAQA